MFDQWIEEGREPPAAPEPADDGRGPEAAGFRCYSLEVLLLLED